MSYHNLDLHHQQVMLATGQSLANACLLLEELTGITAEEWGIRLAGKSRLVIDSMSPNQIKSAISTLESSLTNNNGTIWVKSSNRNYN